MTELRTLEASEYPILCQVADGFIPAKESSIAIVAEQDEQIVGRLFLLCPTHIEGAWIQEDAQDGMLLSRLVKKAEEEARAHGLKKLFAYAVDGEMVGYLVRLGFEHVPMTIWEKDLG